jgi:methionyl-tRNA synthetase
VQSICTQGLNLYRILAIYLKPILPLIAAKSEQFFDEPAWAWADAARPLLGTIIRPYEPLATRLDPKRVLALVDPVGATPPAAAPPTASTTNAAITPSAESTPPAKSTSSAADTAPSAAPISIEEFARVDLRVGEILAARAVEGSDKLLHLRVGLGELGERDIFAGIRAAYDPAKLVGRLIVVVANLAPRKMRFGTSAGMALAAGPGGADLFLLAPDSGAAAGMRVK